MWRLKVFSLNTGLKVNVSVRVIKRNVNRVVCRVFSLSRLFKPLFLTDLVTVLEAILKSRQPREKLQCLYEDLMSNNFRRTCKSMQNMSGKRQRKRKEIGSIYECWSEMSRRSPGKRESLDSLTTREISLTRSCRNLSALIKWEILPVYWNRSFVQ